MHNCLFLFIIIIIHVLCFVTHQHKLNMRVLKEFSLPKNFRSSSKIEILYFYYNTPSIFINFIQLIPLVPNSI